MVKKSNESRCIICGKAIDGIEIRNDYVIEGIRIFNRKILHKYRNYRLVVCKGCYLKYNKDRKSYLKKQATYLGIGIIFAVLLAIGSAANIFAIFYGIIIIAFMYLLSLISYRPALNISKDEAHSIKNDIIKKKQRFNKF